MPPSTPISRTHRFRGTKRLSLPYPPEFPLPKPPNEPVLREEGRELWRSVSCASRVSTVVEVRWDARGRRRHCHRRNAIPSTKRLRIELAGGCRQYADRLISLYRKVLRGATALASVGLDLAVPSVRIRGRKLPSSILKSCWRSPTPPLPSRVARLLRRHGCSHTRPSAATRSRLCMYSSPPSWADLTFRFLTFAG
jgi:hypothetical protein